MAKRRRRAYSTLRYPVEAHIITRASIKQTKADWLAGDGPPSGSDFEFRADGGLAIAPTIANLVSSTSGASFFTDLNADFPFLDAHVSFGGTEDPNVEIQRVIANLHPNRDGSGRTVVFWRCRLLAVARVIFRGVPIVTLVPLCSPIDQLAAGDAAGDVTFDFSGLVTKPKPKALTPEIPGPGELFAVTANNPEYLHPCLVVRISAHKADGSAATNVGWGYDNTIQTFGTGNVLRSKTYSNLVPGFGGVELHVTAGLYADRGSAGGVPKLSIQTGSFTQKTITFSSGNLLDLGGVPVNANTILAALADTPPGTSVTFRIRNDADSAFVDYTDGQAFPDLSLTATQTRKLQIVLTPNAAGNVTPIVRRAGMEEKTIKDLSHVAHIVRYNQHVDPITLDGRITTATMRAIYNGRPDFRSTIQDLLSQNDLASIEIRWYAGDTRLAKKDWTLLDAFEIEDWEPESAGVGVLLLGANAKVQAQLPKYDLAGAGVEIPDSTVSNADGWTDQAGGSTDIWKAIDEDPPDDTDHVRSPTSPSNDMLEIGLSNLADPLRDNGHFVDFRFKKDAAGGENLTLKVQLYQGATLKMDSIAIPVPDEWTDFALALSLAQAQSISDYTDLRVRLTANVASGAGARRVQVSYLRLRVEGQTPDLVYNNQTAAAVYADLLSQAEVPGRLKGQGLTETDTVSKTITDANALDEMRALTSNFGKAVIGTRGVIQVVDMYANQGAVAYLPRDATIPKRIVPGLRERRPRVFVLWNWNNEKDRFDDRVTWQNTTAIQKLGHSRIDALDQRWDVEASKYIYSKQIAVTAAKRLGQAVSAGLILWNTRLLDAWFELECGDRVGMATTRFLSRDPNAARELRGNLGALATLVDVTFDRGFWEITGWVQGYHDIFGDAKDDVSLPKPSIRTGSPAWRGDHLFVGWTGDSKVASVKIATSTASQPAAGTGTAANGQNGELDTGAFTYTPLVYVTITPYTGLAGTGVQGEAFFTTHRLPFIHTMFDASTGKPKRTQDFTDGKYALKSSLADGQKADSTVRLVPENGVDEGGATRLLYRHREQAVVQDNSGEETVTFPSAYQNIPAIALIPDQLITYNASLGNVDQVLRLKDVDVSPTGFIARAMNAAPGATTPRSADFADSNELDAQGETTDVDLGANVPANDDNYTIHYYVEVTADQAAAGTLNQVGLTVALLVDTGGGFVERATFGYAATADDTAPTTNTWTEEQKTITVTGVGPNDDVRIQAKSFDPAQGGSFKIQGGDGAGGHAASFNGVTWTTAADTEESAMPAAGYGVKYIAQEVV